MKIAGQDFLFEQNEILRNKLQNFNTVKASESVSPVNNINIPEYSKDNKPEEGVKVDLSASAGIRGRESQTSKNFPTNDFSTTEVYEAQPETAGISSSVLNQYRFFVQSNQYEGSEGVVKRIFR